MCPVQKSGRPIRHLLKIMIAGKMRSISKNRFFGSVATPLTTSIDYVVCSKLFDKA